MTDAIRCDGLTKSYGRVRALARGCAEGYLKTREQLGFPMLKKAAPQAARKARPRSKTKRSSRASSGSASR